MSLYNVSELYNASNAVLQMQTLNNWSGVLFFLPVYFGLGILLIIGIKTTQNIQISLAIGGFMSALVGVLFAILGVIPVWSPIFFSALGVIGIVLLITGVGE